MTDEETPVSTGLVPVTAPVTPDLPPGWTMEKALSLIDALARNLYDEDYVLKEYGLTKRQYAILSTNEWFQNFLKRSSADWNKAENVSQRLALQSAIVLEKNLPALSKRLGNPTETLSMVVSLAKLLAEMAGTTGLANKQNEPRERFKIVFNLGADVQTFPVIDVTPSEQCPQEPELPTFLTKKS